jgi:DNA-binding transcriptional regulator YhcF (GntR family)
MLTIDLDSAVPIVEQIHAEIRHAIAAGEIQPGQPLPTIRQLADDLGINLNTVARAYRLVEGDGLVSSIRGRGTVVRSAREAPAIAERSVRERIGRTIRELVSDARLAGLKRGQLESLFLEQARALWPKE